MTCLSGFWSWVVLIAAIPGFAIFGLSAMLFWEAVRIFWQDWKKHR